MFSCQESSRLTSQALDRSLNLRERIGLSLHRMICSHCRAFELQLQHIRQAYQRMERSEGIQLETVALPAAAKARILQKISEKQKHQVPG